MRKTYTNEDFENMSWHDNSVYGISWEMEFKSTHISDLILDIDYICEWVCGPEKSCGFKVSPADLIFHGITDLKINIDWGDSGFQNCIEGGLPIMEITRERIQNQKVYLDRPYYKWLIKLQFPAQESFISFGAAGFTQILRKEPILIESQSLTLDQRKS